MTRPDASRCAPKRIDWTAVARDWWPLDGPPRASDPELARILECSVSAVSQARRRLGVVAQKRAIRAAKIAQRSAPVTSSDD